jgi:hypothetical protein
MKLVKITILSIFIIIVGAISLSYLTTESTMIEKIEENPTAEINQLIEWDSDNLFKVLVDPKDIRVVDGKSIPLKASFALKPELKEIYDEIRILEQEEKALVIIPIFTASAYAPFGFYDYYNGNCGKQCLTTKIITENKLNYNSSANGFKILNLLGYDSISDLELHNNPSILNNYEKIVLLHNEYVSKKMFDAITSHNKIIFLYPNALYAEIEVDINKNEMKLIRGHDYPPGIKNGFNYEIEEKFHDYEYDNTCSDWEFIEFENGYALNCYPEQEIWQNSVLLKTLKEL